MINRFVDDFEGRKMTVFQDPEFKKRWADILDRQAQQINGRRMFMIIYCHPIIGHLRIAKWLPKRNVAGSDSEFLTMLSDDLRYADDIFVIEKGEFMGHYQKVTDTLMVTNNATKLIVTNGDDSGICRNCSINSTESEAKTNADPDFVEIPDFSESDTEYEALVQAAKNNQTSSRATNAASKPDLDVSTIDDELERRK